ncbi:MAG: class I SAM-dependent methyltransferase [Blastocatellia bacterium]|nr:class I SAM-dependent methyltransferase [Blastocatellia bacterium]
MPVDFEMLRQQWNLKAAAEEAWAVAPSINRELRWREIRRNLSEVRTILDVGAGTGAFSIPLAKLGFEVTHLDFAPSMLELAQTKAAGIPNLRFLEANANDLAVFPDYSFDLVLNMDGPISAAGTGAEQVIFESCRVARRKVIFSAANHARMVSELAEVSINTTEKLLPSVFHLLQHGEWRVQQFQENALLAELFPFLALKVFLPEDLGQLVKHAGFKIIRATALGTLAHLISPETRQRIEANPELLQQFLELCDNYDREIMPHGPGSPDDTGLIVVAERPDDEDSSFF